MMMLPIFIPKTNPLLCMMLIIGASSCSASSSTATAAPELEESRLSYVEDACSVTPYPDMCIRSLASFSHTAKTDPIKWARAGVSVTIHQAKTIARHIARLKGSYANRIIPLSVSDCFELFQDALDVLHRSLYSLRNFTARSQTEDLITWLSAALTDEDTCLDGFNGEGQGPPKAQGIQALEDKVVNITYITSNALALANKLAATPPPK